MKTVKLQLSELKARTLLPEITTEEANQCKGGYRNPAAINTFQARSNNKPALRSHYIITISTKINSNL